MQAYPEIKHFVQKTLGCTCPEEVFNSIDYQKDGDDVAERKIIIADRLLIYLIDMHGKPNIQGMINSALEQGVEERDRKGFNRFRLVLVTASPDEPSKLAELAFERSGCTDERTHLHVVSERDVEGF